MLVLIVTSINTVTVSLFLFRKIVLYHCHLCWLLICSFLYVFSLYMSVTTRFDHWLHQKYISGRWYYLYKSHVGFLTTMVSYHHHRCWFLLYCHFSLSPPHKWAESLIGIIDYIGSTQLSNHIGAIDHVFHPP